MLEVNYPEHLKKINVNMFFISSNRCIKFTEKDLTIPIFNDVMGSGSELYKRAC